MKITPFRATLFIRAFALRYIPALAFCRPSVVDLSASRSEVKIALSRRTKNHVGGMYIGVLATGADCAGGMLAMQIVRERDMPVVPLFKDMQADFLKRPDGDVHFVCEDGDAIKAGVEQAMQSGERVNLPVTVVAAVPSIGPEPVARFKMMLSLKKKKA